MQGSNPGYRDWAAAVCLPTTNRKGAAAMTRRRGPEIARSPAALAPGEADETCFGGKRKNMPKAGRREPAGRGTVGKTAVAGVEDSETGRAALARQAAGKGSAMRVRPHERGCKGDDSRPRGSQQVDFRPLPE